MTSDWKKCKLSDIIDILGGGTPKTAVSEYWDGNIYWLSVKDFNSVAKYVYKTEKMITDAGLNNSSTQLLHKGDIIISARGTVGELAVIPYDMAFNQSCYGIRAKNLVNRDFLYYLLKNSINILKHNTHGSVFDTITRETFDKIEINLPPLEIQQKIARVLGAIDDKIELNNSINKNLEQQMQSIFLELFPFIFNNANDTLEKIISFSNGKKRPENMGTIPVYGGNGILAYSDSSNSENCVIVGRVGAYCGNTFLCTGPCWVSDNAIQAKSKIGDSQLFIFYILKNAHLQSRHIGTGQPLMTQGILNSIPFNMPDISIIKQFTDNCEPMQKLIIDNTIENERLTQLRDTLLPKLMNGEIDVDKVEV